MCFLPSIRVDSFTYLGYFTAPKSGYISSSGGGQGRFIRCSICSVANYDLVGFELEGLFKTVKFGAFQVPKRKAYNPKSPYVQGGLPCQISSVALGILRFMNVVLIF